MGVAQLWQALSKDPTIVQRWNGKEHATAAAAEIEGKVIAVDLSMWIFQAQLQEKIQEHFSKTECAMKVAFERTMQLLRHGCIPVIVIDGQSPEEKRATQQERFANRNGGVHRGGGGSSYGNDRFVRHSNVIANVLRHMVGIFLFIYFYFCIEEWSTE